MSQFKVYERVGKLVISGGREKKLKELTDAFYG